MYKTCAIVLAMSAASAAMAQLSSVGQGSISGPVENFENDGFVSESQFATPRTFANGLNAVTSSLDDNAMGSGPGTWSWGDQQGGWGLLDSGSAHQTSGAWGIGVDTINGGFIDFALPVASTAFGGYFAAPTQAGTVYGEPASFSFEAYNGTTLVGSIGFTYSETNTASGAMHWMGFAADAGSFDRVVVRATVFVMDDLTWQAIPTPGTTALLGLGGLVAIRRRR